MDDLTPKRLQELAQIILKNPRPDARKEALLEIRRSDHPRVIELLQHVSRHDRDREVRDLAGNLYTKKKVAALQTSDGGAAQPFAGALIPSSPPARPKTGVKADAAAWTCAACGGENSGGQTCRFCGADRTSGAKKAVSDRAADSPALADSGALPDGKIFYLDPANAPGMKGRRASSTLSPGCTALFMLPFVLVGIVLIGFALNMLDNWGALDTRGVVTDGEIIGKYSTSDDDGTTYTLTYQFVRDGVAFAGEYSVDWATYDRAERGLRVKVLYVPDNPAIHTVAGRNRFPIGEIVGALCWNGFIGFFLVYGVIASSRRSLLRRTGQVVFGVLYEAKGRKDSDGDYMVTVRYGFRAPDGRVFEGSASHMRNDLTPGGLPLEGTRVAVLYRSPNHYMLL